MASGRQSDDAAPTGAAHDRPGRDESELERRDRQLDELMQEVRVMQTGVQVLFAFLLGVPFTQRFTILDDEQRLLYFATLLAAGGAVLFLLAPGAWHRALFAQGDKAHVVHMSHRFAICGLFFVALSVCGVVALISTVMYPGDPALIVAVVSLVAFIVLWGVAPVRRRLHVRRHGDPGADEEGSGTGRGVLDA